MYGKIHQEIYYSSLMSHGWLPVHIFIGMVVLSDKDGLIKMDPQILFKHLGLDDDHDVSFDRFLQAINILEDPDDMSNLSAMGGRRIIPLHAMDAIEGNRGWLVVNKVHYREEGRERDQDTKKEYDKGYAAAKRKYMKDKEVVGTVVKVVESSHTDTNTNTDLKAKGRASSSDFEKFWQEYPKKVKKKTAKDIWMRKKPDLDTLLDDIDNRLASDEQWRSGYIPHPTTYLNGERWNDEISAPKRELTYAEKLKRDLDAMEGTDAT